MAEEVVQPDAAQRSMEETAGSRTAHASIPASVRAGVTNVLDLLWRLLRKPWLLIVFGAILLALLAAARATPQLPGQLLESPAEATRWLNSVAANWSGVGGALARVLQLYNLAGAPWFGVLVALVALLALVQLADAIGRAAVWRRLSSALHGGEPGEPIVFGGADLARDRFAVALEPSVAETVAATTISKAYGSLARASVGTEHLSAIADAETNPSAASGFLQPGGAESRLLGRRNGWSVWLYIAFPAALLVAVLLLWVNMLWAWNVQTAALSPGEGFVSQTRDLALMNTVGENGEPAISVATGSRSILVPADGTVERLDGMVVTAHRVAPAIVVSADTPILALPGEPNPQETVGLNFPSPGAEQFVVLPGQGIGIRFVRVPGSEERFLAEVYDEEAVQPVAREQIDAAGELVVPLEDEELTLLVTPAWSLSAQVNRSFASWAWLPLALLALAGLVALVRPAALLCAQISAWEGERSLVILQGARGQEIQELHAALAGQESGQTPET